MTDIPQTPYRPRLSVEVRQDQFNKLQDILPHGTQKLLFQALLDGVIELHNRGGFNAVGAIISGHVNIVQLAKAGEVYTQVAIPKE